METVLENRIGAPSATEVPKVTETTYIEQDIPLYTKVLERARTSGNLIPAEDVLGEDAESDS